MSEKKAKENRKSIAEELADQDLVITIKVDKTGGIGFSWNKNVPTMQIRGILNIVYEQLFAEEIMETASQSFMQKMSLPEKKGLVKQ